jgi:hypothetical protein
MDSASSSPSASVHPLADGVIKGFVCLAGCEYQLMAFGAACFPKSDDNPAATPSYSGTTNVIILRPTPSV